jgi:hypothetical protein
MFHDKIRELEYHLYTTAYLDDEHEDRVSLIVAPGASPHDAARDYLEDGYIGELLDGYFVGDMEYDKYKLVEEHVDSCTFCQATLEEMRKYHATLSVRRLRENANRTE